MPDFVDLFDSREKAFLIWLAVVVLFALVLDDVRRHLPTLARTLVAPPLAIPLLLLAAYVAAVVCVFAEFGVWDISVLDVAIFWFFGSALVAFGKSADAAKDPDFVRNLLRRGVASLLGVEFIVNLYVFPLGVELVLVPLVTVVVMMGAVAETNPDSHT